MELTQALVRELFDYDPEGFLVWKAGRGNGSLGKVAGSDNYTGYKNVTINNRSYRLHRVVFLWHHGYLPRYVDHADRDRKNNHIDNLRAASRSENIANGKQQTRTKSGYRGVYKDPRGDKWMAQIRKDGKLHRLGSFKTPEDAAMIFNEAALGLHDTFAVLNENPLNNLPLEDWA